MSGFGVIGFGCGRCGQSLTGKLKQEFDDQFRRVSTERWREILSNPDNFRQFACMNCGTISTHLGDLTVVTPELKLRRALSRKAELERSIPFYEEAIPKMKEELVNIGSKLPELEREVGENL